MISCRVCDREFAKMITNTHLKNHGMTLEEYKKMYGDKSHLSPDYVSELKARPVRRGWSHTADSLSKMSDRKSGKPSWNSGKKMSEAAVENMRRSARDRELRYRETGTHPKTGTHLSEETKEKIAESNAGRRPSEGTLEKLRLSRIGRQPALGMKHTDETKRRISETSKLRMAEKSEMALQDHLSKMQSIGLKFLGFTRQGKKHYNMECMLCGTVMSRTSQCFTDSKFKNVACSMCDPFSYVRSKAETEIYDFVTSMERDARHSDREIIRPLELDMVIDSKKVAIEYCGLYWHSDASDKERKYPRSHDYHLMKMQLCADSGMRLVTIFEDEWSHKKEIVKSRLSSILGRTSRRIHARKCSVSTIDSKTANGFLNASHLAGSGRSTVRYGIFYDEELVGVMTFGENDPSRKGRGWELNRLSFANGVSVVGGSSKMFHKFVTDQKPETVVSYCDLRWSTGSVYEAIGFERVSDGSPGYWYVEGDERVHRYSRRKSILVDKFGGDPKMTESQIAKNLGMGRIWDCGHAKYVWNSPDNDLKTVCRK